MKKHLVLLGVVLSTTFNATQAVEIGHYNGGVLDIRDYFLPEQPGIYGAVYNYYYFTDRLNNNNGDKISSVNVNTPGGPINVGVDVDLKSYAFIPAIIWVSPCQILGARYGGYIAPSFANNGLEANLQIGERVGGLLRDSSFGVGDLFVQPVWLDWGLDNWDFSLAYGFYAPSGRYSTQTVPLPGGGTATVESEGNIGLGYWTQQVQGGIAWYPMTNKATAVTGVVTYNYNGIKEGFELRQVKCSPSTGASASICRCARTRLFCLKWGRLATIPGRLLIPREATRFCLMRAARFMAWEDKSASLMCRGTRL